MRNRWVWGLRFSSFVDSPNPELVDGPFNEAGHLCDRGLTLRPCADLPLLELLVTLLDDVAGNRAAAVELGLVPFQLDPVGVEVDHLIYINNIFMLFLLKWSEISCFLICFVMLSSSLFLFLTKSFLEGRIIHILNISNLKNKVIFVH